MRLFAGLLLVLSVVTATGLAGAQAQTYPTRSITFLVGSPPGGSTDVIARALGTRLQASLGQPVAIENRPGASEMLAARALANAAADGYTIAIFSNALAINETLPQNQNFSALRELTPLARVAELPFAIMVRAELPVRNLRELVALAQASPGTLNYGHVGVGAPHYLTMEWFRRAAGIDIVPVPFQGSAPLFISLLRGDVQVTVGALGAATQFLENGRVRPLAAMSTRRPTSLPNLPTVSEFGYPEFALVPWMGIFLRAGTPAEFTTRLERAVGEAMDDPALRGQLDRLAIEPAFMPAARFSEFMQQEVRSWARVIQDVGVPRP
ncbi:MAG: tripartite tricarboxylate transporter substrate binding protein [Alphaproteobacteria bacterium]|nr:tripartite tricarboxylate transporter substrate binding protein [Alphaproteobacteria bacterium]